MPSSFFKCPGARRDLPFFPTRRSPDPARVLDARAEGLSLAAAIDRVRTWSPYIRSEEHTSELQSHDNLVCRLLFLNVRAPAEISPFSPPAALPIPRASSMRAPRDCRSPRQSTACARGRRTLDRKSTRLNSSHTIISYAVFFF